MRKSEKLVLKLKGLYIRKMYLFGWMSFLCFGGLNIIYSVIKDKVIEFINMIVMVCFCIVLKYGVNSFVILFI